MQVTVGVEVVALNTGLGAHAYLVFLFLPSRLRHGQ
jgi:hypothetical protein